MNPAGKTALITGGAIRVGKAITLALARTGANVVIHYNSSAAAAEATTAEARAAGVEAIALQADVAEPEQVRALMQQAEAQLGGIDILINSASLYLPTPFPTDDLAGWQRVTRIQIDGAFYCANAAAPGMLARGAGVIINIVDMSAWLPAPGYTAHSVSKAALLALTRQLALELAPKVRVNAVAPGPVLPPPGFTPEQLAAAADVTLLKTWGSAEDVAAAVLFLIGAKYITGEYITVDGGERYGFRQHSPEGI